MEYRQGHQFRLDVLCRYIVQDIYYCRYEWISLILPGCLSVVLPYGIFRELPPLHGYSLRRRRRRSRVDRAGSACMSKWDQACVAKDGGLGRH
jgi:hypothetical protein